MIPRVLVQSLLEDYGPGSADTIHYRDSPDGSFGVVKSSGIG